MHGDAFANLAVINGSKLLVTTQCCRLRKEQVKPGLGNEGPYIICSC